MFVEHFRRRPIEALAGVHHGAGQRYHFLIAHAFADTCGQERTELYIRVASPGDVVDDGFEFGCAKCMAEQLGAHMAKGFGRLGMRNGDRAGMRCAQQRPGCLRKARLTRTQKVTVDHVQSGDE